MSQKKTIHIVSSRVVNTKNGPAGVCDVAVHTEGRTQGYTKTIWGTPEMGKQGALLPFLATVHFQFQADELGRNVATGVQVVK